MLAVMDWEIPKTKKKKVKEDLKKIKVFGTERKERLVFVG